MLIRPRRHRQRRGFDGGRPQPKGPPRRLGPLTAAEGVLAHVVASYEAVPLLAEYAPRVNPQQLKNALMFREEAARIEKIVAESRLNSDRLFAAIGRVASCRGSERNRFAARLLHDLFCYHRDLRGLEALSAGFDSINLVTDDKVRELSTLNGMLTSSCLQKTRNRRRIAWCTTSS